MERSTYRWVALAAGALVLAAGGLAGCGGGVAADLFDNRGMGAAFPLISFADQWGSARPR